MAPFLPCPRAQAHGSVAVRRPPVGHGGAGSVCGPACFAFSRVSDTCSGQRGSAGAVPPRLAELAALAQPAAAGRGEARPIATAGRCLHNTWESLLLQVGHPSAVTFQRGYSSIPFMCCPPQLPGGDFPRRVHALQSSLLGLAGPSEPLVVAALLPGTAALLREGAQAPAAGDVEVRLRECRALQMELKQMLAWRVLRRSSQN